MKKDGEKMEQLTLTLKEPVIVAEGQLTLF